MSMPPPGANPTSMRTVLAGYAGACAQAAPAHMSATATAMLCRWRMDGSRLAQWYYHGVVGFLRIDGRLQRRHAVQHLVERDGIRSAAGSGIRESLELRAQRVDPLERQAPRRRIGGAHHELGVLQRLG